MIHTVDAGCKDDLMASNENCFTTFNTYVLNLGSSGVEMSNIMPYLCKYAITIVLMSYEFTFDACLMESNTNVDKPVYGMVSSCDFLLLICYNLRSIFVQTVQQKHLHSLIAISNEQQSN